MSWPTRYLVSYGYDGYDIDNQRGDNRGLDCSNGEVAMVKACHFDTVQKELSAIKKQMAIDDVHIGSEHCWCHPELIGDYTDSGGTKHYLHREKQ